MNVVKSFLGQLHMLAVSSFSTFKAIKKHRWYLGNCAMILIFNTNINMKIIKNFRYSYDYDYLNDYFVFQLRNFCNNVGKGGLFGSLKLKEKHIFNILDQ